MYISIFESVKKAYIKDGMCTAIRWDQLIDLLSDYKITNDKEDNQLFNCWRFKDSNYELGRKYHYLNGEKQETYDEIPGTIRRSRANALELTALTLDVDANLSILEFKNLFKHWEFFLYTSFSHSADKDKFRVIMPLHKPMPKTEVDCRKEDLMKIFNCDDASFSISQCFYFPTARRIENTYYYHNQGEFFDWTLTIRQEKKEFDPSTLSNIPPQPIASSNRVLRALSSCHSIHYPKGLTLTAICRTNGLNFNDFAMICDRCGYDTLKMPSAQKQLWAENWERATKKTTIDFIREHGGQADILI